jgi:hypothetical protein
MHEYIRRIISSNESIALAVVKHDLVFTLTQQAKFRHGISVYGIETGQRDSDSELRLVCKSFLQWSSGIETRTYIRPVIE